MTWSLSDVIKLNLARGKSQRDLIMSDDELDEGIADVTDSTTAHPIGVMTRADSAPAVTTLADAENTDELRKSLSRHRTNQSVSILPPSDDINTVATNGIGIATSPTGLKMSPRPKGSMSSIASASENSSSALASPASSSFPTSPTVATITSPMMRMPSLTDLALTAQAAHHREAAGTAVGRILATLQSIANVMETPETSNNNHSSDNDNDNDNAEIGTTTLTSPDLIRLTGSLTAQSVSVLSTVQQLYSALAGIMLPKALIDTAAISTHADRGQRLMDAFRELDGIRSQLLQEAQLLSSTVRKSRTTGETLPTTELISRANRILQAADAAVAGARAVARQKEVLSRLLARDQVSLVASPTSDADDSAISISSQPSDNNPNYYMQNGNNSSNITSNNTAMASNSNSSNITLPTSPLSTTNAASTIGSPPNSAAAAISFEARMISGRRVKSIGQLRNGVANDGAVQANPPRNAHTVSMSTSGNTNLAIISRRSLSHRRGTPSEGQVVVGQASRAMVVDTMNIPAVPPTPTLPTPQSATLASPPHDGNVRRTPSGELSPNEFNPVPLLKSRSSNGNSQTGLPPRPLFNRNHTVDVLSDSVRMMSRSRSNSAITMATPSSPLLPPVDSPSTAGGQQHRMVTRSSAERLNNESLVSRMTRTRRVTDANIFIPPPPPSTTPPFNVDPRRTISQGSLSPNSPSNAAAMVAAGRRSPGAQPRKRSTSQRRPSMPSIIVPPHTAPASPGLLPMMPEPPKSAGPHSRSFPDDLSDDDAPSNNNNNLLPMPVQQTPGKSYNMRGRSCSVGSLNEFIAIGSSPRPGLTSSNVGQVQRRHQPVSSLAMPTSPVPEESLLSPLEETLDKSSPIVQPTRLGQLEVNQHRQSIISNISNNRSQNSIDTVSSSLYGYDAMELTPDNIESTTPTPINVSTEDVRTESNVELSPKRIFNGDISGSPSNGEFNEMANHVDGFPVSNSASTDDSTITTGMSNSQSEESSSSAALAVTSPDTSHIASDEDEERLETTTPAEDDDEKDVTRSTGPRVKFLPMADHPVNNSTTVEDDNNASSTGEHSEESESDERQVVTSKRVQFTGNTSDSDLDERIDDDDDDDDDDNETTENDIEQSSRQEDEGVVDEEDEEEENEDDEEEEDEEEEDEPNETPDFLESIPKPKGWYLGYDYRAQDIMFNNNKVSGGTLEALVERLTLHDQAADMDFTKAFLLCFRCFCPPQHLLRLLIDRFTLQPPAGLTEEEKEEWHRKKLVPLRFRVFNITKSWLEAYFIPEEDSVVLDDMLEFVTDVVHPELPAVADRLVKLINKRISMGQLNLPAVAGTAVNSSVPLSPRVALFGQSVAISSSPDTPPATDTLTSSSTMSSLLSSKSKAPTSVLSIDANEIANQLTLMDSKLFCAITPRELIGQEFSKKENSLAVNVKAMSTLSTQVTTWVAETILYENDIKKRANLIKYFIKVGDRCLQLKNYNSVFAIFSALNSSNIQRLKRTWKLISNRSMTSFNALSRACDCTRNFAAYRARLKQELPPCLPFMGVYLTDLTFIEDGNAKLKRCTTATHIMINFSKYLKTVQLLNEIQRFQVMPYPMTEVAPVQNSMRKWFDESITGGDQETLYQASLRLEPREG